MVVTQAAFLGGSHNESFASNITLKVSNGRVQVLNPTAGSLEAALPDATTVTAGGPVFYIINSSTNSLDLTDDGGTTLETLAQNDMVIASLLDDTTSDGVWVTRKEASSSVANPSAPTYIYIIGGRRQVSFNADEVYEFDQQLDVWSAKTASSVQWRNSAGFVLSSETDGYTAGSEDSGDQDATVQYDPDTHTAKTDYPIDIRQHAGYGDSSFGYILGGTQDQDRLTEFDSAGSGAWTGRTDITTDVFQGTAQVYNDDGYLFSGTPGFSTFVGTVQCYDAGTTTWTGKSAKPAPNAGYIGSFLLNDKIYVFRGQDGSATHDDVDEYDPVTDTWVQRGDFPGVLTSRASGVASDGKGYSIGGNTQSATLDDETWEYDVDEWTQFSDMTFARSDMANQGLAIVP